MECPSQTNLPSVKSWPLNFFVGSGFEGFLSLGGENHSFRVAFFSEVLKFVYVVLILRNFPSKKLSELIITSLVFLSGEDPKAGLILRNNKKLRP